MKIKLKNGKEFNVTNATETKSTSLWFLNFVITDTISSDAVDSNFTEDSVSEVVLASDSGSVTLTGYSKIIRATISHNDGKTSTAMQLSKAVSTEVAENET